MARGERDNRGRNSRLFIESMLDDARRIASGHPNECRLQRGPAKTSRASWNVKSIKARLEHVKTWLNARNPDVLLLQELKGTEFPSDVFKSLGYDSVAVTQKAYNGVAILSRSLIESVSTALSGDELDTHARYLEVIISGIRVVDIYLPNGNPVGTEKFDYKLAWMERLITKMSDGRLTGLIQSSVETSTSFRKTSIATSRRPGSMTLFSNLNHESSTAPCWTWAIWMPSGPCMRTADSSHWDYFRQAFENNRGIRIDHSLVSPSLRSQIQACEIDKGPRAQLKPSDHTPILLTLS